MTKNAFLVPFFFGALFSFGLGLSGMMSPTKVQGFLDIAGNWDGALLWVLGGAVFTTLLLFPLVIKKPKPVFETLFSLPQNNTIDRKLLLGSITFGIGWALAGLCPGPALANVLSFHPGVLIFLVTLLISYGILQRAH